MSGSGTSLACYGCVEFANDERTLAYHRWACSNNLYPTGCTPRIDLCPCDADAPDTPYSDPATDEVCWYDPSVPESAEFLGVIVLNRVVRNSTFSREVSDNFIEGSILNRPTIKGRSFVFDAILLATSCEGMAYGKEWLRGVLEDAPCATQSSACESCFGKRMSIRTTCPAGDTTDDGLHEWFGVGLVDGLQDDEDQPGRKCCCVRQQVSFTMQSESPWSHSTLPVTVCDQEVDPDGYNRCYDWTLDCFECCGPSIDCDRCKFDPVCSCFPFIIPQPELPRDDCDSCVPLAKIIQCCCSEDLPGVYDTTFKIDIYSGIDVDNDAFLNSGMRDFVLKIYQNPKGLPCITDDESYDLWCNEVPCAEININYIPYDSTLTIDGRTERITLTCNGVCKPYDHRITNTKGSIFPLLSKCTPVMVCAEFSYYSTQLLGGAPGVVPASVKVDSYLRFRN